jgi:hypothetical protein
VHLAPLPSRYTPGGTGPVFVKVTATTGKVFNGQLASGTIHIKSDAGSRAVPLTKVQSLSFTPEKDTLVSDGETLVGKVEEKEFALQLSVGVLEIPRERMQKLEPGAPLFRILTDMGIPGGGAVVTDAKQCILASGAIVTVGDKLAVEKIAPHHAAALDGNLLFLALPKDELKIHRVPGFEQVMTLPKVKGRLLAHDSSTLVVATPVETDKPAPRFPGAPIDPNATCNLQIFDIKKLLQAESTRR